MKQLCILCWIGFVLMTPAIGLAGDFDMVLVFDGQPARRATNEEVRSPTPPEGFVSAWVWTKEDPPHRIDGETWATRSETRPGANEVSVRSVDARQDARFELIAGPLEMWKTVPESLMPRWESDEFQLVSIPRSEGRDWRLRLVGEGFGSTWLDVPTSLRQLAVQAYPAEDVIIEVVQESGESINEVEVLVFREAGSGVGRFKENIAVLDVTDGELFVESIPESTLRLLILSGHSRPHMVEGRLGTLPRKVVLHPGAEIIGHLVGHENALPIVGAEISVEYFPDSGIQLTHRKKTSSRVDGTWKIGGLSGGAIAVEIHAEGFAAWPQIVEVDAGVAVDLGTLEMRKGIPLHVAIFNELGRPVPDATVRARGLPPALTDSDGKTVLSGVSASGVDLDVSASHYLPTRVFLTEPFEDPVEVALVRSYQLAGRFVDSDGVPIVDGSLKLETGNSFRHVQLGGDGSIDLDVVPDVPYTGVFRSPATADVRVDIPPGKPGERLDLGEIAAAPGIAVVGNLLSDSGKPVVGARLWALKPDRMGPVIAWMQGGFFETTSELDGAFVLSGLSAGPITIRVDAPSFARLYLDLTVEGDVPTENLGFVHLKPGAMVSIEVEGTEDETLSAELDLRGDEMPADIISVPVDRSTAVFENIAEGEYRVRVGRASKTLCEIEVTVEGQNNAEAECEARDVVVSGRVFHGERLVDGGTLVWSGVSENPSRLPGGILTQATTSGLRSQSVYRTGRQDVSVVIDDRGGFESSDVSIGLWTVKWFSPDGGASTTFEVEVPKSDRFSVDLEFPAAEVSGLVVDTQGVPAANARVRELLSGALAFTKVDGSFSLVGLPPGPAEFQARTRDRESESVKLFLEADRVAGPLLLTLDEMGDRRFRVSVIGHDGHPDPTALVFLEADSGYMQVGSTDTSGAATFELEIPVPLRVRTAAFTGSGWVFGNWVSTDDSGPSEELAMGPRGSLTLISGSMGGNPNIVHESGWPLSGLFSRIGRRLTLVEEVPLRISGLPPGTYSVSLDRFAVTAVVRADEETVVELLD